MARVRVRVRVRVGVTRAGIVSVAVNCGAILMTLVLEVRSFSVLRGMSGT